MTMSSWCMQLDDEEDSKDGEQQHSASAEGWQSAGIPVAVTLILLLLGFMLLYTAATAVSPILLLVAVACLPVQDRCT